MTTAVETAHFRRTRQVILSKLERVNAELSRWNEYTANRELPPDLKRYVPRPEVSRDTLEDMHAMLVQELELLKAHC